MRDLRDLVLTAYCTTALALVWGLRALCSRGRGREAAMVVPAGVTGVR